MLTIEELKEQLVLLDEVTLMEALDISSEELVENFEYVIETHYYKLHDLVMGYGMEEEEEDVYDEDNY